MGVLRFILVQKVSTHFNYVLIRKEHDMFRETGEWSLENQRDGI